MPLPSIIVEAFETNEEGVESVSLGMQDLTRSLVRNMTGHRFRLPDQTITMSQVSCGLDIRARNAGWEGRLAMPGLRDKIAAFFAEVGGKQGLIAFAQRLSEIDRAAEGVAGAEDALAKLERAAWRSDVEDQTFLYLPFAREEYAEPDRAYDMWGHDEYKATHPKPEWNAATYDAWWEGFAAYRRLHAPPFAFATKAESWMGITPEEVRLEHEEQGEVDIYGLIENGLSFHYESACDHVKDEAGLEAIVDEWLPHAGSGSEADLALEDRLAAWNHKQDIVSYYVDHAVAVPVFADATREEAIAWCVAEIRRRKEKFAALEAGWSVEESWTAPEPELLSKTA